MKKNFKTIKDIVKENWLYILFMTVFLFASFYPVNYFIIIGGGISNIGNRVEVKDAYEEKGSLNISYVTELDGTLLTYGLSYIIPGWETQEISKYTYTSNESLKEIEFRDNLDLDVSSSNAIYYAYTLAGKPVELKSTKYYVYVTFEGYDTNLQVGDQILEVNGVKISEDLKFKDEINKANIGDNIKIKIIRDNKEEEIETPVYKSEKDDSKIIGIYLQVLNEYKTDPKVNIEFAKDEAGPSGGLITALSIYNKLTKKDITKGLTVAGTGTMEADGSIGQIGGIEYKLKGASKKADIFLVPEGENYEEAKTIKQKKKYKIKIIPVSSLEDAIEKLNKINKDDFK
ncbi:MAG: PDZ domain-containing protein [Bacilli bacterium]|nr:PDZ domain-containing protein [Bacilli bacterium]